VSEILPEADAGAPGPVAELLRRSGWALVGIAAATVLVELGAYAAGRILGIGPKASALAALATAAVWTALAAPAAAAGPRRPLHALCRGGVVADASAVTLIVLWLIARHPQTAQPYVTFLAAVKIYCTLAAMALAAVAVVLCARRGAGRHILAVGTAVVLVLLLSSLLWAGIPLAVAPPEARTRVAAVALWINPFCSIGAAVVAQTDFVWTRYGMMYRLNSVCDYPTPNVPWYAATVCCLCVAGIAGAAGFLRHRGPD